LPPEHEAFRLLLGRRSHFDREDMHAALAGDFELLQFRRVDLSPTRPAVGSVDTARTAAARNRQQERVHVFASKWLRRPRSRRKASCSGGNCRGQGMLFDFHREQPTSF